MSEKLSISNWNMTSELEVAVHRAKSDAIVINYPGITGDIDGYEHKYAKVADFIVEKGIGAVVRSGNQDTDLYPDGMIGNLQTMIDYAIKNSYDIAGCGNPKVYLMGFSAGASAVAVVAPLFLEVEKILLVAPAGDAGVARCQTALSLYTKEGYVAVGENDEVVGARAGKVFYDMLEGVSKRELTVIPNCDHQFRGRDNGKVMSLLPVWAFRGLDTFPSPEGGKVLYE